MKLSELLTYKDSSGKKHVNKVVLAICIGLILIGVISIFLSLL